jgi:hypothetical protein
MSAAARQMWRSGKSGWNGRRIEVSVTKASERHQGKLALCKIWSWRKQNAFRRQRTRCSRQAVDEAGLLAEQAPNTNVPLPCVQRTFNIHPRHNCPYAWHYFRLSTPNFQIPTPNSHYLTLLQNPLGDTVWAAWLLTTGTIFGFDRDWRVCAAALFASISFSAPFWMIRFALCYTSPKEYRFLLALRGRLLGSDWLAYPSRPNFRMKFCCWSVEAVQEAY